VTGKPRKTGIQFTRQLLNWNRKENKREMPWKGEKDPYKIWLSEIILQQTRVGQGMKYYRKFIEEFPSIHDLAAAEDQRVFKLWEGLGYYSRCRNLIKTAKLVSGELNGIFPGTYEEILKLKGIGPYTAAAIGSFAFALPYAVVDGNVYRVLSRYFNISAPVDSVEGKRIFANLAQEILDKNNPGEYNQAIMDFGATICKPLSPECGSCPLNKNCKAFLINRVKELPVKQKLTRIKQRWFNYLFLEKENKVAIIKRNAKDIWQDLYEFPLVETSRASTPALILREAEKVYGLKGMDYEKLSVSGIKSQQLSHQLIRGRFIKLKVANTINSSAAWIWVDKEEIKSYSFPRFIYQYFSEHQ
jgi:A/G-specific adenine glycosylase